MACPGRRLGVTLLEQLRANPANAPILSEAERTIRTLQEGAFCATDEMHPAPASLFARPVQPFWIDLFSHEPASLIQKIDAPVLILQGARDLQVSTGDAQALLDSARTAKLTTMPHVNHVLKTVLEDDRDANLPLASGVAQSTADFVTQVN